MLGSDFIKRRQNLLEVKNELCGAHNSILNYVVLGLESEVEF